MSITYLKRGKPDVERAEDDAKTRQVVEATLADVAANGDAAVRALSEKFDGYSPTTFRLTEAEIADLIAQLTPRELADIKFAQEQVRNFAQAQRDSMLDIEVETLPGVIRTSRYNLLVAMYRAANFLWWHRRICRWPLLAWLVFRGLSPAPHPFKESQTRA